jgi:perosamine synthetase
LGGNEEKYVTEAVRSQWVSTAGGSITVFEKNFAAYMGMEDACACQSGSAGLHLCLRHFGITHEDIVLVPTITFIATINAVMYQSATPVFFDCDDHLCMDVAQIQEYINTHCNFQGGKLVERSSGKQVKAIMPVHVFGDLCDMDALMDIAEKYHLVVIEDATEALGSVVEHGRYQGKKAGSIGHAGVFSFNGNKIITTGGGGMVVSNEKETVEHIRYLSQQAKDDVVYFVHEEFGYNYRMTNLQAALGVAQLEQLDGFIETKRKNYALYQSLLEHNALGQVLPFHTESSNKWFYSFCLHTPSADKRDALLKYLNDNQVQVRPIWKLNHLQTPFRSFFAMPTPKAEEFYNRILNLPCSTNLPEEDVRFVCELIEKFEV